MPDLPKVSALLREGIERGQHLGAQVYVSIAGEPVAELAMGESRAGVDMTADTLVLWLSMGKPVTAALIARLVDAGKLSVEDPVSRFLPGFAGGGKEQVTIAHLLTHSGGFRHVGSNWSSESWEAIISRISAADVEEEWVVGETAGYHTSSSWFILAEVARHFHGFAECIGCRGSPCFLRGPREHHQRSDRFAVRRQPHRPVRPGVDRLRCERLRDPRQRDPQRHPHVRRPSVRRPGAGVRRCVAGGDDQARAS